MIHLFQGWGVLLGPERHRRPKGRRGDAPRPRPSWIPIPTDKTILLRQISEGAAPLTDTESPQGGGAAGPVRGGDLGSPRSPLPRPTAGRGLAVRAGIGALKKIEKTLPKPLWVMQSLPYLAKKQNMKLALTTLLVGLSLIFSSCEKSTTDFLVEKPWEVQSLTAMGTDILPFVSQGQPVSLIMDREGNFDLDLVALQIAGTWSLSADEKQLIVEGEGQTTTWTIQTLKEGELRMSTNLELGGLPQNVQLYATQQ